MIALIVRVVVFSLVVAAALAQAPQVKLREPMPPLMELRGSQGDTEKRLQASTGGPRIIEPALQREISRLVGPTVAFAPMHLNNSGELRFLAGFRLETGDLNVADAASTFLSRHSSLLNGAVSERSKFTIDRISPFEGAAFVRLQQEIDGIRIRGGEVILGIDGAMAIFQITSSHVSRPQPSGLWMIGADDAVRLALKLHPMKERLPASAEKAWVRLNEGSSELLPCWIVHVSSRDPFGDWEFEVDARTGAILRFTNLVLGADAYAFGQNPVRSGPTPAIVRLANLTSSTNLSGSFAKVYSGLPELLGLVAPQSVIQTASADRNGDFFFDLLDPRFSEAHLYYHLDRVHDRFRSIGFRGLNRPIEAVSWDREALVFGPYFSPLHFQGRGGVFFAPVAPRFTLDLALDADVIYHEYTHAVVNDLVGSRQTQSFKALNEGYADYFAGSFLGDPEIAEFAGPILGSRFPFLRSMQNPNRFPRDYFDEVHQASLIWSGALWDLRVRLGAERADRIVLGGLHGVTSSAEYFVAALSTAATANVLFGSAVRDQVLSTMANRGILDDQGLSAFAARELTPNMPLNGQIEAAQPGFCLVSTLGEFKLGVPTGAVSLSIAVGASARLRFYVRFRQPVAVVNNRVAADYVSGVGTEVLGQVSLNSFPELQAGTYYIAIENCSQVSATYALVANFNLGGTNTLALNSGVSVSASTPAGPFLHSRQFVINVPPGATNLNVSLQGTTDVDLYIRRGSPVLLGSQGLPVASAYAETPANNETLTLTRLTQPNLESGTYYIGVYNFDSSGPSRFSLTATISTQAAEQTRVLPLTPGVPVQGSVTAGAGRVGALSSTQYSLQVPPDTAKVVLTAQSSAQVDVLVRRSSPITVQNGFATFDYAFRSSASQARIEISPESYPALQSGIYYFALLNLSSTPAAVSLQVTTELRTSRPSIASSDGIVHGASFHPVLSPRQWFTIRGANLANVNRTLTYSNGAYPTSSDGVTVTVNGVAAPLWYLSPTQINAIVPDLAGAGNAEVIVRNNGASSDPITVRMQTVAPAFFQWPGSFAVATDAHYQLKVKSNSFPGLVTSPGRPGEILILWGTGFGPTSPSAAAGQLTPNSSVHATTTPVRVTIGGVQAEVLGSALAPGFSSLYQIAIRVPSVSDGDHPVVAEIGGVSSPASTLLTIQR